MRFGFSTGNLSLKTITRCLIGVFALVVSISTSAQTIPADVKRDAEALRDAAMEDTIAYDLVESLVNEVGPRPAGSAGDVAAVAWAVEKLESLGFSNVRAEPVVVPHWDRGTIDVRVTSPFAQPLVAVSLGGSPGTPAEGIEAEVVRVESLAALRELTRDDLEGKIVFVDHVMERHQDRHGLQRRITYSRLRALRRGRTRCTRDADSLGGHLASSLWPYRQHDKER